MTAWQKTVKYLAIALAIFLSVSIISGICGGIASFSFVFGHRNGGGELTTYPVDGDVKELLIDISAADLSIKTGEGFRVESNNKYLTVTESDGKLMISEERKWFASGSEGIHLYIYIPANLKFDYAQVNAGAGSVKIEALSADVLELDLGAGEVQIDKLTAEKSARINGGAGELTIKDGLLHNMELDMGVGELNLTGRILGKSDLNYGIGEANMTLLGTKEEYRIELDKGIGEAKLEGKSMQDDSVYGSGDNRIDIDGGIGEIHITFSK
ncbi:MAG: DUF4097 family beta strand repeat-containing protein [Lachnospiraceae bacterium]